MIDGIAFGLNLYPSPPVSSFSSCGHHINVLFSQLFLRCVVVKIATGSSLAHRVQPFYVIRTPIVQNMYKTIFFIKIKIHVFSITYFGKIHQLSYIKGSL